MPKRAIVLSGGGSCGAYQIGVWKALKKLGISYDIITGVSVGALNGVMMVQNNYSLAYKIWSNLDYDLLFKSFINSDDKNITNKDIYKKYVDGFLTNGGMDVTNLELTIADVFDAKKFFSSPIDFGIVVFNLSKLQMETFVKDTLTPDDIKDYIIASASCFPAIRFKEIEKQKYIDGGYGDNLPINLAISLGATEIIAIDLEQIGLKQKIIDKSVSIRYIRPKNDIGSFLIFEKEQAIKNIKYGYNDTLKNYGKLKGSYFSFYPLGYELFLKKIRKKFQYNLEKFTSYYKIFENWKELDNQKLTKKIIENMEFLGRVLKLDDTKIYRCLSYHKKVKKKFLNIPPLNIDLIKTKIKNKDIKSLLGSKYILKYIYINLKNADRDVDSRLLFLMFPKEFMGAIYLISLE